MLSGQVAVDEMEGEFVPPTPEMGTFAASGDMAPSVTTSFLSTCVLVQVTAITVSHPRLGILFSVNQKTIKKGWCT
jgi:hypothetical protein